MATYDELKRQTTNQLVEAYARGLIEQAELENRLEQVESEPDEGTLALVVSDLPGEIRALAVAPDRSPAAYSAGPQQISATHTRIKKRGSWLRSSHVEVDSKHGTVLLDFTRLGSSGVPDTVEVDVHLTHGRCVLFVELGTEVYDELDLHHSTFRYPARFRFPEGDARPKIIVRGEALHSSIKVRPPRGSSK